MIRDRLHRAEAVKSPSAPMFTRALGARPSIVRTRRAWPSMLLNRDVPGDRDRARELIAAWQRLQSGQTPLPIA